MNRQISFLAIDPANVYTCNVTYPTNTTEVYVFLSKAGGTLATLTLTYTDSTKANLSSVVKS